MICDVIYLTFKLLQFLKYHDGLVKGITSHHEIRSFLVFHVWDDIELFNLLCVKESNAVLKFHDEHGLIRKLVVQLVL